MDSPFPAKPGTYALIFYNKNFNDIQAGSLGQLVVEPGWYIYVGSAFGPGGLRGRLLHHLNHRTQRWHIDALKSVASIHSVWFTADPRRLEHAWAQVWMDLPGITLPWKGFGSSDCRCQAHLFRSFHEPDRHLFEDRLQMLYPGHSQAGLLSQVFVYKIVLPGTENLIWRATEENARNENIRIEDNFHDFPRALATALVISAFSSQNQPKLLYYYPSPQAVVGVDLCPDSDLAQGDR